MGENTQRSEPRPKPVALGANDHENLFFARNGDPAVRKAELDALNQREAATLAAQEAELRRVIGETDYKSDKEVPLRPVQSNHPDNQPGA